MCTGVFEKLRKTNVSFVMSVRSDEKNLASTGQIFMKFHVDIFRVSVYKGKISLKFDKNNGYFT
jgi:hypothetical protein